MESKVSGGRLPRLARLGWLARHGVPLAWRRLRQVADAAPEERPKIAERALEAHAAAANEMFKTLGEMKGLALKAGQMLSYLDGALPEAYRPVYQKVLQRLQKEAPWMPWEAVEPVLAAELGRPVAELYRHFNPKPFAAASIGQVHRATLHDGTQVVVKVQYPGVDRALHADLKNAAFLKSFMTPFLLMAGERGRKHRRRTEALIAELSARFLEELDYRREADMQERFRSLLAGDPEILVPRVHRALSSPRVLTSDFVAGRSFDQACAAPQGDRDRWGVALTRVMLRSVYEFRLFNGDPHPGNYLFPDDGRLALLDFGCVKELPDWMVRDLTRYFHAALRFGRTGAAADRAELDAALCVAYKIDPEVEGFDLYRNFVLYCLRPYLVDEEFEFTPEYAGGSIDMVIDGMKHLVFKGRIPRIPDIPDVPADYALLSRLQWGFYSVLARLRARANWHRLLPASLTGPVSLTG